MSTEMKRNHLLSLNGELNRARTGFLRSRSAWLHLVTVWGQYHEKTSLILPVLKSLLLLLLVPLSLLLLVDEITVVTPPDESLVSKYVLKHTKTTTMFKLIFLLILSFYGTIVTYTTFLSRDLLPALFRGSSQIHSGNQTELTTLLNAGATICAVQFSLAFHLCMSLEGTFLSISQKKSHALLLTQQHTGDHGHLYPSSFANLFDKSTSGVASWFWAVAPIVSVCVAFWRIFIAIRKRFCRVEETLLQQFSDNTSETTTRKLLDAELLRCRRQAGLISQERSRTPIIAGPDEPLLDNARIGAPLALPSSSDEDDKLSRW